MQIPKDKILELLRSRGENDKAAQADGEPAEGRDGVRGTDDGAR